MKKQILALILLFMLTGCSGPRLNYNKPGASINDFNRDKYTCVQQSQQSWSAGGSGAAGGLMIIGAQADANNRTQQLFKMCMEARGYTASEVIELSDEERDRLKLAKEKDNLWKVQWNECSNALKIICENTEYEKLFKKSACTQEEISFQQLIDKTFPSEEEKTVLLKEQAERKILNGKKANIMKALDNQQQKAFGLMLDEFDMKNEKNALNLYEGKISWGDYNKNRRDNNQFFSEERKRIVGK